VSRAEIRGEGDPFRGSATASVTIVEFSDFHCPFCKRVQPTLAEILSRYGDKVKLIYRDFPIDGLHPQARKAAEAAQCANDQGKFWPYHDRLFGSEPDGSPEKLKAFAREVGLDLPAFESCLAGGKHQSRVQEDIAEGARHGVTGTPAFFVNGRLLSGAQPLENFIRVIDEELSQKR
jgi:protein-disulfide isomerase